MSATSSVDLAIWGKTALGPTYLREVRVFVYDRLEQLHPVLVSEGREAGDHLVDEAPQAPPIHVNLVAHFLDDFGGQVLGSAADGGGCLFGREDLGEAEVRELDVANFVDDEVFRLEAL